MNSAAMHIADMTGSRVINPSPSPQGGLGQADKVEKPAIVVMEETAAYGREELDNAVDKANEKIHHVMREIRFSVDDKSDRVVITVIDQETKEIIREIPPEQILDMAEDLDKYAGVLFHEKA